jgi:hypothetical protein
MSNMDISVMTIKYTDERNATVQIAEPLIDMVPDGMISAAECAAIRMSNLQIDGEMAITNAQWMGTVEAMPHRLQNVTQPSKSFVYGVDSALEILEESLPMDKTIELYENLCADKHVQVHVYVITKRYELSWDVMAEELFLDLMKFSLHRQPSLLNDIAMS